MTTVTQFLNLDHKQLCLIIGRFVFSQLYLKLQWVANLLTDHLNQSHSPLHPLQFGFRTHHLTETYADVCEKCMLMEKLTSLLDRKACIDAVFLDLKKAFDSVNHHILLSRLTQFSFSDNLLLWFKSYLSSGTQYVTADSVKSSCIDSNIGVPQGSVLGPILFSLFISNLPT